MSGALSAFTSLGQLLGGPGPSASSVSIGPVTLTGIEVPEKLTFGGDQMVAVQQLIGGGRIITTLGRSDAPIGWSGILEASTANARATLLDNLRISGQRITLFWDIYSFSGVLQSFKAEYVRRTWIRYSASFLISQDNAGAATKQPSALNKLVGNSIGNAVSGVTGTIQQVSQTVSDVASVAQNELQTVESTVGPVAAIFGVDIYSKLQGVSSALGAAQGVAGGLSAVANAPQIVASTITSMQAAGIQIVSTLSDAETAMTGVVGGAPTGGIVGSIGDLFRGIAASSTISTMVTTAGQLNSAGQTLAQYAPGGGELVAVAGSPLAQQLDSTSGSFSSGGITYGPEFIAPISQAN